MTTCLEELWKAWEERKKAAESYLGDPENMSRLKDRLLAALCDPDFHTQGNRFDWVRFAREFTEKDFAPPLTASDFLEYMLRPYFAPPGSDKPLSRSRIWWLVRLKLNVEDPVAWLDAQRQKRGSLVKVARAIECPGIRITNVSISAFLMHLRRSHKPRIPDRFRKEGTTVLAVQDDLRFLSYIWGLACQSKKGTLYWDVLFREETKPFPWSREPVPFEQSPRHVVEEILSRRSFRPMVTLFYTGRLYIAETKRLWWGYWPTSEELNGLTIDETHGPVLVEGWDENGWPVGKRVPFEG